MSSRRVSAYLFIAIFSVTNVFIWSVVLFHAPSLLHVSFFSVGEGNAVLVQSPTGANVLINGGPDSSVLRALSSVLGPLDRTLSLVIETDTTASDVRGLSSVFARYRVQALLTQNVPNTTTASRLLERAVAHTPGLLQEKMHAGMRIALGAGAYIEVLSTTPAHSRAHSPTVVVRVVYGKTSFMLTSTATQKVQNKLATTLASNTLASDVLYVGHYGAPHSVSPLWLATTHPRFAVIPVGKNRYGYPSSTTTAQLTKEHVQVLTTQHSTVSFTSDGRTIWQK